MEIAGVIKFKHGGLWRALKALNWSQAELARRSGLHSIHDVINMKRRPSAEKALRIEFALGEAGQYVDVLSEWPDDFRMETKGELSIYREIACEQLTGPNPQELLERKEMVESALERCTREERALLELRYINGESLREIADKEGCTHSNIGAKIQKTLRKIRTLHKHGSRRIVNLSWDKRRGCGHLNDDGECFRIKNAPDALD